MYSTNSNLILVLLSLTFLISGAISSCVPYNSTVDDCGVWGECIDDACYCELGWDNIMYNKTEVLEYCARSYKVELGAWFVALWTVSAIVYGAFIPLNGYITYKFFTHRKKGTGQRENTGFATFMCVFLLVIIRTLGTVGEAVYLGEYKTSYYMDFLLDAGYALEFCAVTLILRFWVKLLAIFFTKTGTSIIVPHDEKRSLVICTVLLSFIAVWHIIILGLYGATYHNFKATHSVTNAYKYMYGIFAIILGSTTVAHGIFVTIKLRHLHKTMDGSRRLMKITKITNLLVALGILTLCIVVFDFLILFIYKGYNSANQYAINRAIILILDTYFLTMLVLVMGKKKVPILRSVNSYSSQS